MRLSAAGPRLIAAFEGVSLTLYNDPAGHCTIGYGHLVHLNRCDGRTVETPFKHGVTTLAALTLLHFDLKEYEDAVTRLVRVPLSQHQFDALVSFCYNVGAGGFENSTVLSALNQRRYRAAAAALRQYTHAVGITGELPGLVRRRLAEAKLFATPDDTIEEDAMPAPWVRCNAAPHRSYIIVAGKKIHVESAAQELAFIRAGYIERPEAILSVADLKAIPSAPGTPEPDE